MTSLLKQTVTQPHVDFCSWRFLDVPGGSWRFPEVPGGLTMYLYFLTIFYFGYNYVNFLTIASFRIFSTYDLVFI